MSKVGYLPCAEDCERYKLCGNDCPLVQENVQAFMGESVKIVKNTRDKREVFADDSEGKRIAHVTAGFITSTAERR